MDGDGDLGVLPDIGLGDLSGLAPRYATAQFSI
jgi:hypothetical protein